MALLQLSEKELGEDCYELAACSYLFNRSEQQVKMLFNLCKKDMTKYVILELTIKERRIRYCPDTVQEVNKIILS